MMFHHLIWPNLHQNVMYVICNLYNYSTLYNNLMDCLTFLCFFFLSQFNTVGPVHSIITCHVRYVIAEKRQGLALNQSQCWNCLVTSMRWEVWVRGKRNCFGHLHFAIFSSGNNGFNWRKLLLYIIFVLSCTSVKTVKSLIYMAESS